MCTRVLPAPLELWAQSICCMLCLQVQKGGQGYNLLGEERAAPAAFAASPSPPLSAVICQAATLLAACHRKGILPSHAAAQKLAPSSCLCLAGGNGKPVRNGSSLRLLCQQLLREVAGDLQKQSGRNQDLASSF